MEARSDHRLPVFLARHCALGVLAGWTLLAAILYLDVARLRELIFGNGLELTALLLVAGGFAVTFGSLAMGTAIFLLPRE